MTTSTHTVPAGGDPFAADLTTEAARKALEGVSIPSCPAILVSLLEESRRDEVDFTRISRLVGGDVALAASVLKTANSPFFALRKKVQSIQQAVAVLGLRNLLKIVYGCALRQSLGSVPGGLERFWERSNYSAVVASLLAKRWPQVPDDQAYTFGLFYEAGTAVLAQRHATYAEGLKLASAAGMRIVAHEMSEYHTSHVVLGAMLARGWYLADEVVWAIRYHHDPAVLAGTNERAPAPVRNLVALGMLTAHMVGRFMGDEGDLEWPICAAAVEEFLNLSAGDTDAAYEQLRDELEEIRALRT